MQSQQNKLKSPDFKTIQLRLVAYMALKDLWFKKFRSGLTILGVVIGIGSIFLLLSFGLGLQQLVQKEVIGSQSINSIDVSTPNSRVLSIDNNNVEKFRSLPNVESVTATHSNAGKIQFSGATVDAVVYGVDDVYLDVSNLSFVAGESINTESQDELLLNSSLLEAIGINSSGEAIDKKVRLTLEINETKIDKDFTIRGVVDSGSGSEIFVSKDVFSATGAAFSQAKIIAGSQEAVPDIRRQVESLGFSTVSPLDTIDQINQVFKFLNFILVGFGSIGMIIAILGMLNTLTVSLLERTQEIALMMAMGGRKQDMRRLFMAEATILALVGGIIGILGASILGGAIDVVINQLASERGVTDSFTLFSRPLWLISIVIAFMIAVGVLVAYVPAKRASTINPIDALRH